MTLLVQTERILDNFRALQKQAGRVPLLPLLEANACGLGDAAVARLLAGEGVRTLAVSRLEEAVRVAETVRGVDILLMTPYAGEEDILTILKNDLIAAVGSNDSAVLFSSLARQNRLRARVQLCFDFGTGRFGYEPQEAAKAAQTIKHLENVELSGVFTVLPSADCGKTRRQQQVRDFRRVLAAIEREGLSTGITHMADVGQAAECAEMKLGAVRAGADLFGRGPQRDRRGLKRVGRAVSEICDLKWLTPGCTAGDDGRRRIRRATRVAVVPAGLADGLFTDLPEEKGFFLFRRRRWCEIGGKKAPVIGRVGLTAMTVDVTDIECAPGDIVSFDADPVGINAFIRRDYV
ncbi:MAG: hypothetical protein HFJ80_07345 [Clostridiales bacterium]|nr:hypothetical protein [Clostridiales bacterium]